MKEKTLEQKLVHMVRGQGGIALKFVSPGMAGVPDRLILLPGGKIVFCELKAPGNMPRPLQLRRMEQLRALGFKVCVADNIGKIGELLNEICSS